MNYQLIECEIDNRKTIKIIKRINRWMMDGIKREHEKLIENVKMWDQNWKAKKEKKKKRKTASPSFLPNIIQKKD